ncbi:MAG: peptidoglycan DD-metalloendopeptidase family protein [Candidatus Falkowbacteria bacterium]
MFNSKKVIPIAGVCLMLLGFAVWRVYDALGQAADLATTAPTMQASNPEIERINQDISSKKSSIDQLKSRQNQYKQAIQEKQAEQDSLQNELAIYDNRIAAAQANIEDVQLNIEKTELEIKKIDLQIQDSQADIERQRQEIATALGILYQTGDKSDLEIMLLNNNLSDFIDQVQHIKDLNNGINERLQQIKETIKQLENNRFDMAFKRLTLKSLQEDLQNKLADLTAEKEGKQMVLSQTNQSESEYQRLLGLALQQERQADADVSKLEAQVRLKLANSSKFKEIGETSTGYIWPVPKNTITAYFHDPSYPFRKVMEHPAVDIRAGQGTVVKAAASGYVARVKVGTGGSYGYIMIVHPDGRSTVYGHVSKIYVSEEQYVNQGDVIGLSGGMPGTNGAGPYTTGPHLHFEVRMNGIPTNPLDVLP